MKPNVFKRDGGWFLARPRLLGFTLDEANDWELFGPFDTFRAAIAELEERFTRFGSFAGHQTLSERFSLWSHYGEYERWKDT